ncbi:MAG TPA: hypothetical protein VM261_06025 [Kofleriaceae bacterium]|nr:hypothetical protein [Kofleriaceae bacterium]
MARAAVIAAGLLAGCNSIVGFDVSGGVDASNPPVTLIVTTSGEGRGAVRSQPTGIACPPSCSDEVPQSTTVTLTATAGSGSRFGGWGSPCSGTGPCELTVDADMAIDARFDSNADGHNFVFVTKGEQTPAALSSLSNADAICAADAAASGLPGTYRAWLSTSTVAAKDRLGTARGWVRVDGRPVADSLADLTAGKLLFPVRFQADGTQAVQDGAAHAVVVTGTSREGTMASTNCADWTSSTNMARTGNANSTGRIWTDWFDGDPQYCSSPFAFYCFGIDETVPLTVMPSSGRLAFVTSNTWTPGGGVASADAFCQGEANTAGRSGTFKALVASTTASAASRFDVNGAPWVRADAIPLAAPGTSPFAAIEAPLNVRIDGSYLDAGSVATGATSPTALATTGTSCGDWTVSSAASKGIVGSAEDTVGWFTEFGPFLWECNNARYLYCFEQ